MQTSCQEPSGPFKCRADTLAALTWLHICGFIWRCIKVSHRVQCWFLGMDVLHMVIMYSYSFSLLHYYICFSSQYTDSDLTHYPIRWSRQLFMTIKMSKCTAEINMFVGWRKKYNYLDLCGWFLPFMINWIFFNASIWTMLRFYIRVSIRNQAMVSW